MNTIRYEGHEPIETAQIELINHESQHDSPGRDNGMPPEFGAAMVPRPPDPSPPPRFTEQPLPTYPREADNNADTGYKKVFNANGSERIISTEPHSDSGGIRTSSFPVPDLLIKPSAKTELNFKELLKSMRNEVGILSELKREYGDKYFTVHYEDLLSYPCEIINDRFGKIPLGEVTVITGGTGNGKTEFTKSTIIENARNGKKILAFFTEDTEVGFTKRVVFRLVNEKLAALGRKPMSPIDFYQRRNVDNDDIVREAWEEADMLMDNIILAKTSVNASFLTEMLRISAKLQDQIDLIVIDTLQSVTGIKPNGKDEDARSITIQTVKHFMGFAAKYNIAVIIVSHITRESSKNGELTIDSLYGASEIAKLASTVVGIQKVEDPLMIGHYSTELLLLKSRMGTSKGEIILGFDPNTTQYFEISKGITFHEVKSVFESDELPPPIPPDFSKLI